MITKEKKKPFCDFKGNKINEERKAEC